ncbi:MAG: DEAD/DEAH box helicase [Candidatus Buchananbacteria bacterium]
MTQQTFDGLGIAPKILEILDKLHFTVPTPIQHQSIQPALFGKDIMGIAQTGTGKTLAFGVPMIQLLAQNRGRGLVLLPTRELAVQVNDALNQVGKPLGLKTAVLIGGENINRQIAQLSRQPHIIIATPGRLIDHLDQRKVSLTQISILILDEADRMLDMGFAPQIKRILQAMPQKHQTMLFSATMPSDIVNIAKTYMQFPVRVEVAPSGTATANVSQELFFVHKEDKPGLLETILKEYKGSVLVFCRTKFGARKIAHLVRNMNHTSTEIHSNRSLGQRLEALAGFKMGRYRVMVATDIAARGLDVTGIELVINYDLPEQANDYVHRIGRTGRASHVGHAISFATPDQRKDVKAIERVIQKQLAVSNLPELPKRKIQPKFIPATSGSFQQYQKKNTNQQFSDRILSDNRRDHNRPHVFKSKRRPGKPDYRRRQF